MTPESLRRIGEVLDLSGEDEIDLGPLVEAVRGEDIELGTFTDEELHWAGADADADPEPLIDAPRLGRMDADSQSVALSTAMWMLQARGDAEWDGESIRLRRVHAVVGEVRHEADAAASVQVQVRAESSTAAAVYRLRPDLFAVEYVAPEGIHWLLCCSAERAAVRLASIVDPCERATVTLPAQTGRSPDDLDPHPDALAARAKASAFALVGERGPDGREARRGFTAYGAEEGLFVYHGVEESGRSSVGLQQLAPADLVAYCGRFLAPGGGEAVQ